VFSSAKTPMTTKNKDKPKDSVADDAASELNVLRERVVEMMKRVEGVDNDNKRVPKTAERTGKKPRKNIILL
jgi:hypothetical protein